MGDAIINGRKVLRWALKKQHLSICVFDGVSEGKNEKADSSKFLLVSVNEDSIIVILERAGDELIQSCGPTSGCSNCFLLSRQE